MTRASRPLFRCAVCALVIACGSDAATGAPPVLQLSFVDHPTTTQAGVTITPLIRVAVRDLRAGTGAPTGVDSVSVVLGANPAGATLRGTTTVPVTSYGNAYFRDLSLDRPGAGYTLVATARGVAGVTSNQFCIFDMQSLPARIDSVALDSATLTIEGPGVAYRVSVSNALSCPLSQVYLQAYIDQGSASLAAAGSLVLCGGAPGDVPLDTCIFPWKVVVSNFAAGSGTLVAGPATLLFELRQRQNLGRTLLLDTLVMPVTLVN